MLDPARSKYVTASQAYNVMADFETELEGKSLEEPSNVNFDQVASIYIETGKAPLVRDMKDLGTKITGAEITEICKYVKAKRPVFSTGMETVARMMVMGEYVNDLSEFEKDFVSEDMQRGNFLEGDAVRALSEYLDIDFTDTEGEQKFMREGHLGVTPDGIEYAGFEIKACAEVKNLKGINHMKYLSSPRDQQSLLKISPLYYWQCQCGLAVTKAQVYHFASYHPGFKEKYRIVHIPVRPNADHIDLLKERAKRVVDMLPLIRENIDFYMKKYGEL